MPLGNDVDTLWKALLTGKNGAAKNTLFDASTFPTTFDAEVKDYDFRKYIKNFDLHKNSSRGSGFVIGATVQACKQAGIDVEIDEPNDGIDRTRMGIYLGAGEGSIDNDTFFAAIIDGWEQKNKPDGLGTNGQKFLLRRMNPNARA